MSNQEINVVFDVPAEHLRFMIENGLSAFSQSQDHARLNGQPEPITPSMLLEWKKQVEDADPREIFQVTKADLLNIVSSSQLLTTLEQLREMLLPPDLKTQHRDDISSLYAPLVGLTPINS